MCVTYVFVYHYKNNEIARNCNCGRYQRSLAGKFFDEKKGSGMSLNEQLLEELRKPAIKKIKKKTVYARLKDNT